jgi:uncharacterized protein YbjT (DUF2867 family)
VKILLFGATGLAGGGVLRACLDAPDVSEVRAVVRRSAGVRVAKLREIIHDNYLDYSALADAFAGVDACYFCLGVSVTQVPDEADRPYLRLCTCLTHASTSGCMGPFVAA